MIDFTFKLRGIIWKVIYVPSADPLLREQAGITYLSHNTVYVNNDTPPESVLSTLWHELAHVFLEVNAGSKDFTNGKIDEELACNLIGEGMLELISQEVPRDIFDYKPPVS